MNHRFTNPFFANCYQRVRFLPCCPSMFSINFQGQEKEIAPVPWVLPVASLIKTALTALSCFADWGNRHTRVHKHVRTHRHTYSQLCAVMKEKRWANRSETGNRLVSSALWPSQKHVCACLLLKKSGGQTCAHWRELTFVCFTKDRLSQVGSTRTVQNRELHPISFPAYCRPC